MWRGPRRHLSAGLFVVVAFTTILMLLPGLPFLPPVLPQPTAAAAATGALLGAPGAAGSSGELNLSITAAPSTICASGQGTCSAGTELSRVTMQAVAPPLGTSAWPAVQIVFVVETTPFDGVFDVPLSDYTPGWNQPWYLCQAGAVYISCGGDNSVEAFIGNAGQVAQAIQAANPMTRISFGLVDYFATHDAWDDGDGNAYHVDVGNFVSAADFAQSVHNTLQTRVLNGTYILDSSGLGDNFLHSSAITALYGTLVGAGIDWANDAHHVIVWLGSSSPRDPNYPVDYCPSISAHVPSNVTSALDPACFAPTCEPSYDFGNGVVSPQCEGWTTSQDGNPEDSIAALAQSAPPCVQSLGGNCTIDTLQTAGGSSEIFWNYNWTQTGSATSACSEFLSWRPLRCTPDGLITTQAVLNSSNASFRASCALASTTGGSWDGGPWLALNVLPNDTPVKNQCRGVQGDLAVSQQGGVPPIAATDEYCNQDSWTACGNFFITENPALVGALSSVGLGQPTASIAVLGAPSKPFFQFVPFGSIELAPNPSVSIACHRSAGYPTGCEVTPRFLSDQGREYLAMNWSDDPNLNVMQPNDTWSASFYVEATGPPFETPVPVDACITPACEANGSGAVGGLYSWAAYVTAGANASENDSFPLARLIVEPLMSSSSPSSSAPPPPPANGVPPPVPSPIPVPTPVPIPVVVATVAVTPVVSLQVVAAGVLAAGFTRAALRLKPVAVRSPVKNVSPVSRFDQRSQAESERFTRTG